MESQDVEQMIGKLEKYKKDEIFISGKLETLKSELFELGLIESANEDISTERLEQLITKAEDMIKETKLKQEKLVENALEVINKIEQVSR